jgi:hypothetical protein
MKSKTSFFNRTVFKKNVTLYWPIWVCYLLYGMVKVPGQLWSRLQQQTDMTAYARDYATVCVWKWMWPQLQLWQSSVGWLCLAICLPRRMRI